jgi:hypothetical protein
LKDKIWLNICEGEFKAIPFFYFYPKSSYEKNHSFLSPFGFLWKPNGSGLFCGVQRR